MLDASSQKQSIPSMDTIIILLFSILSLSIIPPLHGQNGDASLLHADTVIYPKIKVGIHANFASAVPTGRLRGNMDAGYGFGVSALVGKYGFPLKGGLQFNTHWHDQEHRVLYFDNGEFDERHDIYTTSYSFMLDAVLRAEAPWDFFLQPYADAFLGFNRFSTRTRVDGEDQYDDDPDLDDFDDSYLELGDWAWAYGVALGLRVNLHTPDYIEDPRIMLDLRAAYRRGGAANYLRKLGNPGPIEFPIDAFEQKKSTTDMMQFHIGVSFLFP